MVLSFHVVSAESLWDYIKMYSICITPHWNGTCSTKICCVIWTWIFVQGLVAKLIWLQAKICARWSQLSYEGWIGPTSSELSQISSNISYRQSDCCWCLGDERSHGFDIIPPICFSISTKGVNEKDYIYICGILPDYLLIWLQCSLMISCGLWPWN